MPENKSRTYRIPLALQQIFLSSNKGAEVSTPPPNGLANKVFSSTSRNCEIKTSSKRPGEVDNTNKAKGIKMKNVVPHFLEMPPQKYLDALLRARGYSTKRYKTMDSAYYNMPTPLQTASFDSFIVSVVQKGDVQTLRSMLEAGISPNACNMYGGSLVHMACRRSNTEILKLMLEFGCDVRVSDEHGRTPLHVACWTSTPSFETIQLILERDLRLFYMSDSRGEVPLNYVRKENWSVWIQFLESKKDEFWPQRDIKVDGEQGPPELTIYDPNTKPIPDPKNALPLKLATRVAQGKLEQLTIDPQMQTKKTNDCNQKSVFKGISEDDLLYILHDLGLRFV